MMRVVIRADASVQIGSGHVMRCLTLAEELQRRGAGVTFVCREHPSNLIAMIEEKGFTVVRLPQPESEFISRNDDTAHAPWLGVPWELDASETVVALGQDRYDWIVVDHYALDRRWEALLRPHAERVMVIDDLADRPHDCDLLLDQNLYLGMESRYVGLLPEHSRKLLGPAHALLRDEFMVARRGLRERDGSVRRIIIFFGGIDPDNATGTALTAILTLGRTDLAVDVVVASANPHREELQRLCAAMPNIAYHCQIDSMASLMAAADLAIGAGGSTMWERCCLGLPTIILAIAENQVKTSEAVASAEAAWYLGCASEVSVEHLAGVLTQVLADPTAVRVVGERAYGLMAGAARTVAPLLLTLFQEGTDAYA